MYIRNHHFEAQYAHHIMDLSIQYKKNIHTLNSSINKEIPLSNRILNVYVIITFNQQK